MALLTKDQIIQADDRPYEDVEVPEWGGQVRVRTLSLADRDTLNDHLVDKEKGTAVHNALAIVKKMVVAMAIVGEDGERLFSDAEVEILSKKSAKALERVYKVAERLSATSFEAGEEIRKNS